MQQSTWWLLFIGFGILGALVSQWLRERHARTYWSLLVVMLGLAILGTIWIASDAP